MPAPSPWPILFLPGTSRREAIGEILRFIRHLADDDSIVIDEAGGAFGDRAWGPQRVAGAFHEILRLHRSSGRPCARRLFSPMRDCDELPSALRVPGCFWPVMAEIRRPVCK
jgi:hypothetical protein